MNTESGFVAVWRGILQELRVGDLTPTEYKILLYIIHNSNPYGVSNISLENVNNDLFLGRKSVSHCNKVVLSLRRKRYIWYKDRRGRRGSFPVHIDNFLLSKGKITSLKKYFEPNTVRDDIATHDVTQSDVPPVFETDSQSFEELKQGLTKQYSREGNLDGVRGPYNKNENEKKKENEYSKKEKFELSALEEADIKQIDSKLGGGNLDTLIDIVEEHGMHSLHATWAMYIHGVKDKDPTLKNYQVVLEEYFSNL